MVIKLTQFSTKFRNFCFLNNNPERITQMIQRQLGKVKADTERVEIPEEAVAETDQYVPTGDFGEISEIIRIILD